MVQEQDRHKKNSNTYYLVLEPGKLEKQYWKDVFQYKELFWILAWRDILVRYKQTYIGIVWALIRPFLTMVVFTIVFGKIANLPTEGNAPYTILVFAAMLPWQFFSTSISSSSESLIANSALLTKVYFPRIIVPAAAVITSIVDFLISFGILFLLILFFKWKITFKFLLLPFFLVLLVLLTTGLVMLNIEILDMLFHSLFNSDYI